jgi:hypothetical protein
VICKSPRTTLENLGWVKLFKLTKAHTKPIPAQYTAGVIKRTQKLNVIKHSRMFGTFVLVAEVELRITMLKFSRKNRYVKYEGQDSYTKDEAHKKVSCR